MISSALGTHLTSEKARVWVGACVGWRWTRLKVDTSRVRAAVGVHVLAAKVSVCAGCIRVATAEVDGIAKPADLRIVANAASWQSCRIRRG